MTADAGSPFSGAGAAALVDALLTDPVTGGGAGTTAAEVLTAALRAVNEGGVVTDVAEGERGLAAVAVLLAEAAPELLAGAPRADELRERLRRWDTELTPARATLCRAVLRRLAVPEQNAWWDAVVGAAAGSSAVDGRTAAPAVLERLDALLVAVADDV